MCLIRVRAKLCRNGPDLRIPVLEEYAASDKVSECYQAVWLDVLTLVCRLEANRRDIHLKPSGGLQNSRGRQRYHSGDTPLKQARDFLQSCIRIWNTKKYNQLRISRGIKKKKKKGKSVIIYLPSSCSNGAEVKKLGTFLNVQKIVSFTNHKLINVLWTNQFKILLSVALQLHGKGWLIHYTQHYLLCSMGKRKP